jgi:hypothetical protein
MENTDMLSSDSRASWTSIALKHGILIGLITAVISLIELFTGSYGGFLFGTVSFDLVIFLVVVANRNFKKQNDGYMSYGQGFKLTFLTLFTGAIISALIIFIYLSLIDPAAIEAIKEAKLRMIERIAGWFGASLQDEKMEEEMAKIEEQTTAFSNLTENVTGAIFSSLFLALIIPAFTKHTRPEYE